jgi:hypothetical protein
LQRQYAGHVFLLRGYVENTEFDPPPREDWFELTKWAVKEREQTEVVNQFRSPPLAAYIDQVPMEIRSKYDINTNGYSVTLIAPPGKRVGPVRLVWPSKTLISTQPLRVATDDLDIRQREAFVGGDLLIGMFPQRPIEVHIGSQQVPDDGITYENHVLQVRVPAGAEPGPILIVTEDRVFLAERFNLLPPPKDKKA